MRIRMLSGLLYIIIFATGAAGLIFQVTWQRYLGRLLGSDSISIAIILATFLGGLSFGYYLCGKFSMRVKNHFKAYALLEGTIGVWCLFFPSIFHTVDALTRSWSFAPPVLILLQGVFCSALLMGIPTICMGGTLPFLTRGLSRNVGEATHIHANVYAINTAGAFLGTLLAGFYLIPTHGLPLTIMGASFLNLGACIFFYFLALVMKPVETSHVEERSLQETMSQEPVRSSRFSSSGLYMIAFLSGFYVMTLENVLIRIANFSLGSSSYSFSLIVAVFILAIAVGSYVVGRLKEIPGNLLFTNQLIITLLLLIVYVSLDTWPYWAHVMRITFQSNIAGFWGYYSYVFVVLGLTLGLPVAFMGATVPIAFHELKRDLQSVGRDSGLLFSWNTLGNLSGSLIGGIVLYYFLNNAHVFLSAVLLAACSTCAAAWYLSKKYFAPAVGLTILIGLFTIFTPFYHQNNFMVGTFRLRDPLDISLTGPRNFFTKFNRGRNLRFYKDGPTCSVAVVELPKNPSFDLAPLSVFVNGKSDSDAIGDTYTLKLSAHIASLLAESRKNVMVIGLGTGVTAGEFTLYPDVQQIDIAEISPAVIEALPYFNEYNHNLGQDPRMRMHTGDAFRILGRSEKKWDIIISEPSNPWVTGVDLLFTREYYRLVREHLTDKGILVQWTQLYATTPEIVGMILNTVQQEFKQARVFRANPGDLLIIASNTSFSSKDLVRAEATLRGNSAVRESLKALNLETLDSLLIRELWTPSYIADHFSHFGLQTMDNPRLHYMAGKSFFIGSRFPAEQLYTSATVAYLDEYLMRQRDPQWINFPVSEDTFAALFRSTRDVVRGGVFETLPALRLRGYLSNSKLYPLSQEEKRTFNVHLLPFITSASLKQQDWKRIGLEGASFRQKAQPLVEHVRRFRNWIVPYPVDGLKALLQEGIAQGKDAYEKNWCALQLAMLLLRETSDQAAIDVVLERLIRGSDGSILLREQDNILLYELNSVHP